MSPGVHSERLNYECTLFISLKIQGRNIALMLCGGGEGSSHAVSRILWEPSKPHSPTLSTVQYISSHPSPCALRPPKYQICLMKRPT